jgi:hypothetical protein
MDYGAWKGDGIGWKLDNMAVAHLTTSHTLHTMSLDNGSCVRALITAVQ